MCVANILSCLGLIEHSLLTQSIVVQKVLIRLVTMGSLNPIESFSGRLYCSPQDTQSLFTANFGNWRSKLLALRWVEPLLTQVTHMPCSSMSVLISCLSQSCGQSIILLKNSTLFREALSAVHYSNQLDSSSNGIYMFQKLAGHTFAVLRMLQPRALRSLNCTDSLVSNLY